MFLSKKISLAILVWLVSLFFVLPLGTAQTYTTPSTVYQATDPQPKTIAATCDPDGTQSSGALYRICMPNTSWNGDLVIYAHGYVNSSEPLFIQTGQLPNSSTSVLDLVSNRGYAFATTSYSTNGTAVLQGLADVVDLVDIFSETKGQPNRVFIVGVSMGALVTTLAVEQYPDIFDGGIAACGPIGSYQGQINYFGDFRVVFDYYFPDTLPPSPVDIPQELMDNFSTYSTQINTLLFNNQTATSNLLAVTGAAYDIGDLTSIGVTVNSVLWYNVYATNDATTKLGGLFFDNENRVYSGSSDDAALNDGVERFTAEAIPIAEVANNYETSGNLTQPLVVLHTTLDPIVPLWHQTLYADKITASDSTDNFIEMPPINRYGHCNFTATEIEETFDSLINKVLSKPSLQLTKSVQATDDIATLPLDSVITYTISLSNSSAVTVTNVLITDTLPPEITFGGYVEPGTLALPNTEGTISWGPYDVLSNTVHSIIFTATINNGTALYGENIVNTAWYTSSNAGSGSDEAVFTIEGGIGYKVYLPFMLSKASLGDGCDFVPC